MAHQGGTEHGTGSTRGDGPDEGGIVVRRAGPGDADLVARMRVAFLADHRGVDASSFPATFEAETRSFVAEGHDGGWLLSWLAEGDGACVGVVSLLVNRVPPRPGRSRIFEGYVINMFVVPGARSRGVGRALLQACLDAGPALGVVRFVLKATDDGRPLYESVGFRERPGWIAIDPAS